MPRPHRRGFCVFFPTARLFRLPACGEDEAKVAAEQAAARQREAIRRVFDLDAALAKPRDQATTGSNDLAAAVAAIRQYVSAVSALDLSALPEDVRTTYAKHLDAWRAGPDLIEHHSGMRGVLRATIDGDAFAKGRIDAAQEAVEQ